MDRGSAWLERQREKTLSREVTYRRPSTGESVTWSATLGARQYFDQEAGGALLPSETRDYLGLAASLILGGVQVEPKPGDVIVDVTGGRTLTCEVYPVSVNQPAFEYSDRFERSLRVHTKVLTREPLP